MTKITIPELRTGWLGQTFYRFDELPSTNTWIRDHAQHLADGTAVIARHQTAGKGRMGRTWALRKDAGLALSFLLSGRNSQKMAQLPLLAGLGVCLAIEEICGLPATLKWPNDVLIGGQKVCGILCENRIEGTVGHIATGIGINLTQSREDLDSLGLVYATSLFLATNRKWAGEKIAAAVLNALEPLIDKMESDGFSAFRSQYEARCINIGRESRLFFPDGVVKTGTAVGISGDGALICNCCGRLETIAAGEVSVRGIEGYV